MDDTKSDMPLILTIDQSTSATKAILFSGDGQLLFRRDRAHCQITPQPGWVEHDPAEILENTRLAIADVLTAAAEAGTGTTGIQALSITNQRETVVLWDRETGKAVCNALVWQDSRAGGLCGELETGGHAEAIREITGLTLSPYFSAAKIAWVLRHLPVARELADTGRLLAGTIDSWLVWNLTVEKRHVTDLSNASRMQLLNLVDLRWDQHVLGLFDIPAAILPEPLYSDSLFGHAVPELGIGPVPVTGVLGDSHAALFGQRCFAPGEAKATYGTGSSIMMQTGTTPVRSGRGLVTSIAWGRAGQVGYVLEGNIQCTGATVKWLVEDLGLLASPREAETLAVSVAGTDGVYLVPAFSGLGAPWWDSDARAALTGMTRGTKKAHVVRAAEESIAYQIKDVLDLMAVETDIPLQGLRVDGGPTRDRFLMQFQADMLGCSVTCSAMEEVSALGSCLMAGLAVGLHADPESLPDARAASAVYEADMPEQERERLHAGWLAAVARTRLRG